MTPEERQNYIDRIRALPEKTAQLVTGLSEEQLNTPYDAGEWTVQQVVHHLPDAHINSIVRLRNILTQDHPTLYGYDQVGYAELPDVSATSIQASLRWLSGLHTRWADLFENLSEEQWQRTGVTPTDRVYKAEEFAKNYANHGEEHLRQIQSVLDAMQTAENPTPPQPIMPITANPERQILIDKIRNLRSQLEALVGGLSAELLNTRSIEGEWTVQEIVHHLPDSHMNSVIQLKNILTTEYPVLVGYDQEAYAGLPDVYATPIQASLDILYGLHERWCNLFERLSDEQWIRTGNHTEIGEVSVQDLLNIYAQHGEDHLEQIQRTLDAIE